MALPQEVLANLAKNVPRLKSVKPLILHFAITKFDGKRPILVFGVRPADATATTLAKLWKGDEAVKKTKPETWKLARGAIQVQGNELTITPATRGSPVTAEPVVRELFKSFKATLTGSGVEGTPFDRLAKAPVTRPADTERLVLLPDDEADELPEDDPDEEDFVGPADTEDGQALKSLVEAVEEAMVEGRRADTASGVREWIERLATTERSLKAVRKRLELARLVHARGSGKEAKARAQAYAEVVQRADALLDRINQGDEALEKRRGELVQSEKKSVQEEKGEDEQTKEKEEPGVTRVLEVGREALKGERVLKSFDRPAVILELAKGVVADKQNAVSARDTIVEARRKAQLASERLATVKPSTTEGKRDVEDLLQSVSKLRDGLARVADGIDRAMELERGEGEKAKRSVKDQDTIEIVSKASVLLKHVATQDVTEDIQSLRVEVAVRRKALTDATLGKVRFADSLSALSTVDKKLEAALQQLDEKANARARTDTLAARLLKEDEAAIQKVLALVSKADTYAQDLVGSDSARRKAAKNLHTAVRTLLPKVDKGVRELGSAVFAASTEYGQDAVRRLQERQAGLRRLRGALDEAELQVSDPKRLSAQKQTIREAERISGIATSRRLTLANDEGHDKLAAFMKKEANLENLEAWEDLQKAQAVRGNLLARREAQIAFCKKWLVGNDLNVSGSLKTTWQALAETEPRDKAWQDSLEKALEKVGTEIDTNMMDPFNRFSTSLRFTTTGDLVTDHATAERILSTWASMG